MKRSPGKAGSRVRSAESGYALLLVFLMASVAAIALYMEVPRVAQETQRQKEQLLIERGAQYKRAIQLFLRANNNQRWPADMDQLQSFNGKRFLRHKYKDPMTGKDEWRLIHIQNGMLTDSLINKPGTKPGDPNSGKDALASQAAVGDYGSSVGSYNSPQQQGGPANLAQRRRASDSGVPGGAPFPGGNGVPGAPPDQAQAGGQPVPGQPGVPPVPGQPGVPPVPGQPGMAGMPGMPGQPGVPGMPGQMGIPGLPGQTGGRGMQGQLGVPAVPGLPGQPGVQVQGIPQQPGQNPNNQTGYQAGGSSVGNYGSSVGTGGAPTPQPNTPGITPQYPGQYPVQYPGATGQYPGATGQYPGPTGQYPGAAGQTGNTQNFGGGPNYPPAPGAVVNPQGGFQQQGVGTNPGQPNAAQSLINGILTQPRPGGLQGVNQGQVIGGGIAGVASTAEGDSIMVYHDHSAYNEWEFVFDPTKVKWPPPNPVSGAPIGTPAGQLGSMPSGNTGTPAGQMGTMPGQQNANPANSQFGSGQAAPDIRGGKQ